MGVLDSIVDVLALRVEIRKVRRVYVIAALVLGLEDELELALLGYLFKVSPIAVELANLWTLGEEDRTVEHGLNLCAKH